MLIAGRLLGGLFMESWARWKEAVLASTALRIVTKGAMPGRTNFPSLDWSGLPIFSPLNNTDKQKKEASLRLDAWSLAGADSFFAGLWLCTVLPVEEQKEIGSA